MFSATASTLVHENRGLDVLTPDFTLIEFLSILSTGTEGVKSLHEESDDLESKVTHFDLSQERCVILSPTSSTANVSSSCAGILQSKTTSTT